ncbi:elongation factor G [Candidatus Vidania fulgoroideorum]
MKLKMYRNIGIFAHIDAGKTTTTERILFYSGKNYKIGEVHEGTTVMDWMPQEQERGITITSACTTILWKRFNKMYKLNIIDTPGHVDFTVEVERSMRVLDGACIIICGVGGIQSQTETIWRQMEKFNIPRIFFINKMDRSGVNYDKIINDITILLQTKIVKLSIPIFKNDKFLGIIDLINMKEIYFEGKFGKDLIIKPISKKRLNIAILERKNLIETIISPYEDKLDKYFDNKLDYKDILSSLRDQTLKCNIFPVTCGSAFKNKGIQYLLDSIIDYLPSPKDKKGEICKLNNKKIFLNFSKKDVFVALLFKIVNDPFVGYVSFLRIFSGLIKKGDYIINYRNNFKLKVSRILQIHADKRIDIENCKAGDIVAIPGIRDAFTGDTICKLSDNKKIFLEKIDFPSPVISISIIPKDKTEQEKLYIASKKISQEDPSLFIKTDKNNGNIIVSGMGELHLEIFLERLEKENNLSIKTTPPSVSYKETIEKNCLKIEGKYIRQSGGRGQYGHVVLGLKPRRLDKGISFVNKIKYGVIPKEYIPYIKKGIIDSCKRGVILGFPVVAVEVTLYDGSFHEVDSNENAFKIASSIAFQDGIRISKPYLLEPIMEVVIETPKKYLGNIVGNLNSRRGIVYSNINKENYSIIKSFIPLNEMFKFSTPLRSLSQGRASYTMKFSYYKKLPIDLYEKAKN